MTNQSSSKRKSVKEVHAFTSKDSKTPKKRGRKVVPPINRPTLPMEIGKLLGPQQSFELEYAQDIMQQQSDNLDCEMYVAVFADKINIPSISFQSDYLCNRYATLLWKYGMDKFKAGYVSDNDDSTRQKSGYTIPAEGGIINVE
ncbi:hypothetical protein H5410_017159 [Solanum commersonii]|uniref:Ulp1 protease family, C-terminal catalytic domain containing protein n=1 Tax=Solanum commersonii TaxID=4109 RepID=A0A9J5ZZR1_SOLCO|nr:hypothetical protein H5410_017159 [Solanum commersonii]